MTPTTTDTTQQDDNGNQGRNHNARLNELEEQHSRRTSHTLYTGERLREDDGLHDTEVIGGGWVKTHDDRDILWTNVGSPAMVQVNSPAVFRGERLNEWTVLLQFPDRSKDATLAEFDERQKAIDFARGWMFDHGSDGIDKLEKIAEEVEEVGE